MNMKMKSSNSILGCSHLMMLMKNNLPYICMVMCNIVYAGMVLFSKAVISKGMNPYIFGAYRQAFATLALAPFAFYLERKNSAPLSCSILCKILVSLIGITLCLNLWNISLSYIPATFASSTSNAIPAITFIMAILLRYIKKYNPK
ncbi:WAT1-related protein At1g43650-like [Camellia sinensis]|uniref:WAT1-related protein At1g43650-like n=1 Tax=Camellia sinensis TaxID=4442 RepID=UPI001036B0E0|nr:WAT1-related protein At1g43650-like [Camellia sinensis]